MPGILAFAAIALGIVCILADEKISRTVWRAAEDPQAGAASARVLGFILFVGGGVAFLAWTP